MRPYFIRIPWHMEILVRANFVVSLPKEVSALIISQFLTVTGYFYLLSVAKVKVPLLNVTTPFCYIVVVSKYSSGSCCSWCAAIAVDLCHLNQMRRLISYRIYINTWGTFFPSWQMLQKGMVMNLWYVVLLAYSAFL